MQFNAAWEFNAALLMEFNAAQLMEYITALPVELNEARLMELNAHAWLQSGGTSLWRQH